MDKIPWKLLLSRKEVWAIIISHFCHNWGVFILLTWMPTYYAQVLKFDLLSAGLAATYPWLCMAICANIGGWIADSLVAKGTSRTTVRKVMQSIGFLGPAFFLTQLQHVTHPVAAVACMCCCQGLDAFSQSGLYSNHQVRLLHGLDHASFVVRFQICSHWLHRMPTNSISLRVLVRDTL